MSMATIESLPVPLVLKSRNTRLREFMDAPDCDPARLTRTYAQFARLNPLLSGWDRVYRRLLYPRMDRQRQWSLLDVGCGGADIARHLLALARRDDFDLCVHAIDPDRRAIDFATAAAPADACLTLENCELRTIAARGDRFDFVVCNHLLHHLDAADLQSLCRDAAQIGRRRVIWNDIERSDVGYALFAIGAPLFFPRAFTASDGLRSIRRSYTRDELAAALPDGWMVTRQRPCRLVATYDGVES
jgi:2-polyprenyl-3-methyl-5-hydroxy-6-metoxy-1,4-benzoquinol methylase